MSNTTKRMTRKEMAAVVDAKVAAVKAAETTHTAAVKSGDTAAMDETYSALIAAELECYMACDAELALMRSEAA